MGLVTVIGSGSGGNAYWLEDDGHYLMLDLGLPWDAIRRASGYRTTHSDGALVTHEHKDHSKAVDDALGAGVDVYMSQGTAREIEAEGHRLHHVKGGQRFNVGPWTVHPFDVRHDVAEPLGFFIGTPSGYRVLYATDLAHLPCPFEGITHLMIEANHDEGTLEGSVRDGLIPYTLMERLRRTHMSLYNLEQQLPELDLRAVRRIWLLHMSENNANEELIVRRVKQLTGKPVTVAQPFVPRRR